ncbi:MarR family transcriptional regulator [Streptomyces sp. NPDC050617]|uniref:MarR family transcriptional regulator n=1 Tax=Streptomyces sp. NPDC050617 TaxID=3154628 RepID=UPI0034493B05
MTQQDRQSIASGLADGRSYAEIARRLHRPTSTISREVARNGGPSGYRPQQAHRATVQRARRGVPSRVRAPGAPGGVAVEEKIEGKTAGKTAGRTAEKIAVEEAAEGEIIELAVRSGLPRITARIHIDLLLSEDGRRTAAELTRRLGVSPASVSVAVNYLVEQGYVRRERDPRRRRDIYVVDADAPYNAIMISARQTIEVARAAMAAAETFGRDTPVGRRLTREGTFLERVIEDMMTSAERWRGLLS